MILFYLINAKDERIEIPPLVNPRGSKEEEVGPSPPRDRGNIRKPKGKQKDKHDFSQKNTKNLIIEKL